MRTSNPTIGFPNLFISNDEASAYLAALNMINNKTLVSNAIYAPLGAYLQIPLIALSALVMFLDGTVSSLENLKFTVLTHPGYFLFVPRLLSALFGTLMILAIYKIARALSLDGKVSLIAAFLAAVSFNFVHISTIGRAWPQAMFFYLLAILFTIHAIRNTKAQKKNILLSFIFVGLAFGFHQVGIFGLVLVFLLLLFTKTITRDNRLVFLLGTVVSLAMFLIFSTLSASSDLISEIKQSHSFLRYGSAPIIRIFFGDFRTGVWDAVVETARTSSFGPFLRDYFLTEPVIFIFLLLFLIKRNFGQIVKIILLFGFLFLLTWGFLIIPHLRYMFPVIIFGPIFAAIAIVRIFNSVGSWPRIILAILIVVLAAFNSLYWSILIAREATFDQVRAWIETNVEGSTPIVFTKGRFLDYVPSSSALAITHQYSPNFYKTASSYIWPGYYPDNVRDILYSNQFPGKTVVEKLDYVLTTYETFYVVDYYWNPTDRVFGKTKSGLELVKTFSPATPLQSYQNNLPEILFDANNAIPLWNVSRPGPYFDILKVI